MKGGNVILHATSGGGDRSTREKEPLELILPSTKNFVQWAGGRLKNVHQRPALAKGRTPCAEKNTQAKNIGVSSTRTSPGGWGDRGSTGRRRRGVRGGRGRGEA